MLDKLITGCTPMPPKIVLYAEDKIGKSTFASQAPNPIFIDMENGLNYLDVTKTPFLKNSADVIKVIQELIETDHEYKTVVIDTIDWLEEVCLKELLEAHDAVAINDPKCKAFAYGGGYGMLKDKVTRILHGLDILRDKKGMNIILLAHSTIRIVENDPLDDKYETHELKLGKQVGAKVKEWVDIIMFARNKKYVAENKTFDAGRILLASKNAAFAGGGRVEIKEEMELSWDDFIKHYNKAIKGK